MARRTCSFAFRDFERIGTVRGHVQPQFRVQLFKKVVVDMKGACNGLDLHLFVDHDFFCLNFRIERRKSHAMGFGIIDDVEDCQEPRYVGRCLLGQLDIEIPEIVQVVDLLCLDPVHHGPLAAVVTGEGRCPIPEHLVEFLEISNRGVR